MSLPQSHLISVLLQLIFTSLFASESCLQLFDQLAHGSVALGEQISFWWCVFRQIRSKEVNYSSSLFSSQQLIEDTFIDLNTLENYQQEFELVYNQTFAEFPSPSFKRYCRYQRGFIMYHSTSYNRRGGCASYNVCVNDEADSVKSALCHGQVLFYFYVANVPFFFFKRYSNSKNLFSAQLSAMDVIPDWRMYLDRYYAIVRHSRSQLVILPCSSILCKCIFIPFNIELSVCTPIELELEHD